MSWTVINHSGLTNRFWQRMSWTEALTNGCAVEAYVRASDDRMGLGSS
jgi:hypothetical protein